MIYSLRCKRPGRDSRGMWRWLIGSRSGGERRATDGSPRQISRRNCAWICCGLVDDLNTHVAGRAGDDANTGFLGLGIKVFGLEPVDFGQLLPGDLTDLVLIGFGRAARDIGRLLEQDGGRRGLQDEAERLV